MVAFPPNSEGYHEHSDEETHHLHLYVTKGVTGVWVGHVKEIPSIIVQASTEKGLDKEADKSLTWYWHFYPQEHDKLFPKHKPMCTEDHPHRPLSPIKAEYHTIQVTVPAFS